MSDASSPTIEQVYDQLRSGSRTGWQPGRQAEWREADHARQDIVELITLNSLAVLDDVAITRFSWRAATTPRLEYLTVTPIYKSNAANTARMVAEHLSRLLRGAWRWRVTRTWLTQQLVLIGEPDNAAKQMALEALWLASD